MAVVTISRLFGAGGSSVAGIVAGELGADVVDKKLIEEVARRLEMEESDVEAEDERPRTLLERLVRSFSVLEPGLGVGWTPPYPDPLFDSRKAIVQLTEQVIREVAAAGNVVIVGRGAGFVLTGPDVIRVFLHAPEAARLPVIMARLSCDEPTARRRIHETDANRAAYIRQLYGRDWQAIQHYDMVINTARVGYASAADMILRATREPVHLPIR